MFKIYKQSCSLIIFKKWKNSQRLFMGLYFGLKLGGGTIFEITLGTWISTYVVSNWTIFCGVFFNCLVIVLSMPKVMFQDINSYSWAKNGYNSCLRKNTKSYCLTLQSLFGVIERVTAWFEGQSLSIHHNDMPRNEL